MTTYTFIRPERPLEPRNDPDRAPTEFIVANQEDLAFADDAPPIATIRIVVGTPLHPPPNWQQANEIEGHSPGEGTAPGAGRKTPR